MAHSYSVKPAAHAEGSALGPASGGARDKRDVRRKPGEMGGDFGSELAAKIRLESDDLQRKQCDLATGEGCAQGGFDGGAGNPARLARGAEKGEAGPAEQEAGESCSVLPDSGASAGESAEEAPASGLPLNAAMLNYGARGNNVAAVYKTVQDKAFPGTALAPWGTGISRII